MVESRASLIIGGVVPAVLILVVMPAIAGIDASVLGMPLLFAYMFALFPVTTVCLWIAWRIDAPRYGDQPATDEGGGQ